MRSRVTADESLRSLALIVSVYLLAVQDSRLSVTTTSPAIG